MSGGRPSRLQGMRSTSTSSSTPSSTPSTPTWPQATHPSDNWNSNSGTAKAWAGSTDRIPAFNIPLAFFSSLRANLQISFEDLNLSSSYPGSLDTTPDCLGPVAPLHPPSTTIDLSSVSSSLDGLDDLEYPESFTYVASTQPSPWTYQATTDDDRREALNLVSDSVAQLRPFAVRCIVLHPAVLSVIFFVLTVLVRCAYYRPGNGPIISIIGAACLAGALIAIQRATRGYLQLAQMVGDAAWLKEGVLVRQNSGGAGGTGGGNGSAGGTIHNKHHHNLPPEDEIIATKYGDEIVGVLVLRTARTNALTSGAPSANGMRALRHRHSNSSSSSSGRLTGVIRAWTVKHSYRHQGIGRGLLESAVSTCRIRRLDGPIFAVEHSNAYTTRLLPWIFNKRFEKHEEWARSLLREVIEGERKAPG